MARFFPGSSRLLQHGLLPLLLLTVPLPGAERRTRQHLSSHSAGAPMPAPAVQVRDVPFGAVQVITRSQGASRWETRGRMARDSMGSTYLELVDPGSGEPTAALIVDVPNKREIVLELRTHRYRIRKVPGLEARAIPAGWTLEELAGASQRSTQSSPVPQAGPAVQLGVRRIHGVESVGTRSATTDGGTLESWFAVDLGLAVEMTEIDASHGVRRNAELTEILRAEPDPALFRIPKDFRPSGSETSPAAAAGEPADGI